MTRTPPLSKGMWAFKFLNSLGDSDSGALPLDFPRVGSLWSLDGGIGDGDVQEETKEDDDDSDNQNKERRFPLPPTSDFRPHASLPSPEGCG